MDILLRLFGLSKKGVEPGGMVTRLVAVGIHTDKARDVGLVAAAHRVMPLKEAIQEGDGFVLATYMLDPRIDIVRHVGAVLPAVGLGEMVVHLRGVEGREPCTVALGVGKAVAVDDILPALAAIPVFASNLFTLLHLIAQVFAVVHCPLGHLCDTPVVVGIFKSLAHALVIHLRRKISLPCVFTMCLGAVARRHHSTQQLYGTIACQHTGRFPRHTPVISKLRGFKYHRDGVIANHAMRLVRSQFPHGQLAALLEVLHGGIDEVDGALGLNARQQRMQGAVGVPQREDGVNLAAAVGHMNLVVGAAVAAVGVAPEVGRRHAMVQCGVEAALLLFRATFHLQLAEGGLPGAVGTLTGTLEVLIFGGVEVGNGAVDVHTADGHLKLMHFRAVRQKDNGLCGVGIEEHLRQIVVATDGEKEMLVGIPRRALAPSHQQAVLQHNLATEQHIAVMQVEDKSIVEILGIGVAVVSHAAVGGEFDGSVCLVEQHLVIARLRHLVLVREMRLIPIFPLSTFHFPLPTDGHQQHIAVVGAAGAAEVGVAEAVDGVVRIVVATASVPAVETSIWRRLNHAKRHNGTGKRVSVAVGAHHGVNIRGQALFAAGGE